MEGNKRTGWLVISERNQAFRDLTDYLGKHLEPDMKQKLNGENIILSKGEFASLMRHVASFIVKNKFNASGDLFKALVKGEILQKPIDEAEPSDKFMDDLESL